MQTVQVVEVTVGRPMGPEKGAHSRERRIYPAEVSQISTFREMSFELNQSFEQARERLATYAGRMTAKIRWSVNGGQSTIETRECGYLPIMVKVSEKNSSKSSAGDETDSRIPHFVVCSLSPTKPSSFRISSSSRRG